MPAHGKGLASIEHPGPVDALINFRGEILDFLISKVLPSGENATQENRRINGGEFALFPASTGFHMNEMKKEAVLVVQSVSEEAQSISNAFDDFGRLSVAAVVADAKAGQAESRGGDARHQVRVIAVGESAIFHL